MAREVVRKLSDGHAVSQNSFQIKENMMNKCRHYLDYSMLWFEVELHGWHNYLSTLFFGGHIFIAWIVLNNLLFVFQSLMVLELVSIWNMLDMTWLHMKDIWLKTLKNGFMMWQWEVDDLEQSEKRFETMPWGCYWNLFRYNEENIAGFEAGASFFLSDYGIRIINSANGFTAWNITKPHGTGSYYYGLTQVGLSILLGHSLSSLGRSIKRLLKAEI